MTVTRNRDGTTTITQIIKGHLFKRTYHLPPERAKKRFIQEARRLSR